MKMLKLEKSNNCIIFQTLTAEKQKDNTLKLVKSNRFYITRDELNKIETKTIISNDIYSFAKLYTNGNKLKITFTWLDSDCSNNLKGNIEYIEIELIKFDDWYYDSTKIKTKILIKEQKTNCKLNIHSKKIPELIKNKKLKKEFSKICMHLSNNNYNCSDVNIFDDNVNNFNFNFYFTKYQKDTYVSNGGIIWSNYDKDIKKHCYSIHT